MIITALALNELFEASQGIPMIKNNSAPPALMWTKEQNTSHDETGGRDETLRQKHSHSSVHDGYQQSALHTLTTCSQAFEPDSTTLAQSSVVYTDDSF